jgi:hypothetical protein
MKDKSIPRDCQINLFRRLQNLRKKGMTVKDYTEDLFKLNIRAGHRESDDEKVARYINGLRYEIQDDINMVKITNVEDSYQISLKAEDKLARKQSQRGRDRILKRGKEITHDGDQKSKDEVRKPHIQPERGGIFIGRQYTSGINTFPHGRG